MKWKLIYAFGFAFSTLSLPYYTLPAYQHTYPITASYKISSHAPELSKSAIFVARLEIGFCDGHEMHNNVFT